MDALLIVSACIGNCSIASHVGSQINGNLSTCSGLSGLQLVLTNSPGMVKQMVTIGNSAFLTVVAASFI